MEANASAGPPPYNDTFTMADYQFHFIFYKITVPALFGVITVVGVVGNLLVVFVIASQRDMRSTVNLLLINLAVSDLVLLTACVPFASYHYAADTWAIAGAFCALWQFVLAVSIYVTVYTLVAVSVVRFLTIVYGHRLRRRCGTARTACLVLAIWTSMTLANIPTVFSYKVKQYGAAYRYCGVEGGRRIYVVFFVFTYVVPLALISTSYVLLTRFLRASRRRSSLRDGGRGAASERRGRRRTAAASRIVLVVVVVFAVCWLPLHVNLIWANFGRQPRTRSYEVFRVMCHCLAYANSCMNPVVYNYVSKDFRRRFAAIWKSCLRALLGRRRRRLRSVTDDGGGGDVIMRTFDYQNENATCNGGVTSPTASRTIGDGEPARVELHAPEVDRSTDDDGAGTAGEEAGTETVHVTKQQENHVPVTEL